MTGPDLGFAIVGTGMVARYHAEAIARTDGARLVAVCRADEGQRAAAATRFGVPCEATYEALLQRPDVDIVCICTPSGLHAGQTIAAAHAGKHVLVEKPMALTLSDANAMIRACREAGVYLAVAQQRRTDPLFESVRDAIAANAMGRLVLGTVSIPYTRPQSYYDSAAWRGTWALDGGGALMNQGIHLVDLLVWYMGDVADVQAHMTTLTHAIEVEDCVTATLRFTSGALGSIVATTAAAPGYPHRVEVYGDRGGVQLEGETIVRAEGWTPPTGVVPPATPARGPIPAGAGASPTGIGTEGHTRLVTDLVAAIHARRAPIVSGEEGRRALALVLAIYESARTGLAVKPG
jgi:UDP-N-acetyl-2-amino-2-deoxyglucuronate dehydrogenase